MSEGVTAILRRRRVLAEWPTKLWLGAALVAFVNAGYFGAQHATLRTPVTFRDTVIDRAVAFSPAWTPVYFSLYLLLTTAWLAKSRRQLWRYAAGMIAMGAIAFPIFVLWPVAGPRPAEPASGFGAAAHALLLRIDGPLNSFPSLHVALAVYAVAFVAHVLDDDETKARAVTVPLLSAWAMAIAFATLATKQHYFVDVVAGAALGLAAAAIAFRAAPPAPRPALTTEAAA